MKKIISSIFIIFILINTSEAENYLVKNIAEFNAKVKLLLPSDTITMANGEWNNVELLFNVDGAENKLIVLTAQTAGLVKIQGNSNLTIDGNFLHINGLLFVNGYSKSRSTISFAADSKNPSNNCRVSNCAIIDYNKPDRFSKDNWVAVYGKNNRFDHNYLAGKLNAGVTMAVYLNSPKSQENNNRIDHNYFGERKRLGSNGGETLRVGTSTFSLVSANTTIEDNYFEKCNGEVEALSIKASNCIIRRNAFFETEGCLALRHGNNNQVSENLFIGNGKVSTSGLRIINAGHKVFDNYFFRLSGERFRAALAVMNGVPNSAINRYHRVKDVKIYNNTFIDCKFVEFGVGSDNERTATPLNTVFNNNTVYQSQNITPISIIDDMSGMSFNENYYYSPNFEFEMKGFVKEKMFLKKDKSGFYQIKNGNSKKTDLVYNISSNDIIQKQNAGPDWLKSFSTEITVNPKTVKITNTPGELEKAVSTANIGDTLILVSDGVYVISETLKVDKQINILASSNLENRPQIIFNDDKSRNIAHILLVNGAKLNIKGISFNGTTKAGNKTTCGIGTDTKGMINPYWLIVDDCEFFNFNESKYNAFRAEKSSFADTIAFRNCLFHTFSGDAISISAEKEDRGIYNAEYVKIENCVFFNVMGAALDLYRGGNDESTLGPYLEVNHCLFENVNNKELGSVLRLIGVQNVIVSNSIFANSGQGGRSVKLEETRWNSCVVSNCNLYNSGRIESFYDNVTKGEVYNIEPVYFDKLGFDFRLKNQSEFNKETTIGLIY